MPLKRLAVASVAVCCLAAGAASAQDATQAEASLSATPPPAAAPAPASVPKGTSIVVEITDLVSTRTAQRDDMFNLKLAEPVKLNGATVIPAGTPGKGQVVDAAKPGMGGKPGKLVLAARYLELDGQQIPIRGLTMDMTAKDNSGAAIAATMAVGIFGLAVTGGNMEVQPGTRAHAKLGADFVPTGAPAPATEPQTDGTTGTPPDAPADTSAIQTDPAADTSSSAPSSQ